MGFDKEKIAELYPGAENMMFPPMKYYVLLTKKLIELVKQMIGLEKRK